MENAASNVGKKTLSTLHACFAPESVSCFNFLPAFYTHLIITCYYTKRLPREISSCWQNEQFLRITFSHPLNCSQAFTPKTKASRFQRVAERRQVYTARLLSFKDRHAVKRFQSNQAAEELNHRSFVPQSPAPFPSRYLNLFCRAKSVSFFRGGKLAATRLGADSCHEREIR